MCVLGSLPIIIGYIHVLLVMVLCRDMASSVALVMAPLLPWICSCVVNMGFKMGCQGGWVQGGRVRGVDFYTRISMAPLHLMLTWDQWFADVA